MNQKKTTTESLRNTLHSPRLPSGVVVEKHEAGVDVRPQMSACLMAVMDIYSRYIVSWKISNTLETGFCCEALKEALEKKRPEYFNTDQGVQFTSKEFISILKSENIKISMDGKGRVIDNIFIERFWRTLKYEEVYTKSYESVWECKKSIGEFIEKYNAQRLHQSLKQYDTPLEAYLQMKLAVA